MTPQTFRAPHMMAALETIQRELGPEAVVLSVREVADVPAWQVWKHPGVEVVAMGGAPTVNTPAPVVPRWENPAPPAASRPEQVTAAPKRQPSPEIEALLAHLAAKLEADPKLTPVPAKPTPDLSLPKSSDPALPPTLVEARERLLAHGLASDITERLVATCAQTLGPTALKNPARVKEALRAQLSAGIRTLETPRFLLDRVVCLVGTSGVGKTSTAAKLAARAKKLWGRKVTWVCADTIRAGAIAQASALTESLAIPLRVVYTAQELSDTLAAEQDADLILVDTPACNPRHEAEVIELAGYLTAMPGMAIYPVLSATAKEADLGRAAGAFTTFKPRGLILTHLDETETLGNVINLAWQSRHPLAFYTAGPGALDDLHAATANRLVETML